jgi:hypothetical protein
MQYKEKLHNLDFKLANSFLSEQTLNFGNKSVITFAFIILLCLNFISINREFGLVKGIMQSNHK